MTRPFQMHNLQNPYITSDFDDRRSRSTSLFYHYPAQNAMLQQKLFQLFNKHPILCWFFVSIGMPLSLLSSVCLATISGTALLFSFLSILQCIFQKYFQYSQIPIFFPRKALICSY